MRYFKADYLGETDPTYTKLLVKEGVVTAEEVNEEETKAENIEIQRKLMAEYAKIRDFDMELIDSNKKYKSMKIKAKKRDEKIRERIKLEKEKKKREIEQKKKEYIKSNKRHTNSRGSSRSKASNSSIGSKKGMRNSKGFKTDPFTGMKRPSSSKGSNKSARKQILNGKIEPEKDSGTFLTGVQNPNKYSKMDKRIKDDLGIDVNEEFDQNANQELELIYAHEEILNQTPRQRRRNKFENEKSETSSQKSSASKNKDKVDFIKENTQKVGKLVAKSYTDKLTDNEKSRLQELEDEIEQSFLGDEETTKKILAISDKPEKERLELMSSLVPTSEAGESGMIHGMRNAYVYEEGERMETINDELKTKFLALPPPSDDITENDEISSISHMQASVFGNTKGSEKDIDAFSERSLQLTQISKRSGISGISHSLVSKLNKPVSLPKDKFLREKAEGKLSKKTLKEIDSNLDKIRNFKKKDITEDQMSKLVVE